MWNYRLCAEQHKSGIEISIREVYYDSEGNPNAYSAVAETIRFEPEEDSTIIQLFEEYIKMYSAAKFKPILWIGDKWPQKYE